MAGKGNKKGGKSAPKSSSTNQVWEATPGVYKAMQALIAKRHPRLATIDDKIAILFQEKASKSGGQVVKSRVSKASKTMQTLGKTGYIFVITIPADIWLDMEGRGREREALLDHCLCQCGVTEKEDGSETYQKLNPDLRLFSSNVKEYGLSLVNPEDDIQEVAAASIEEMFGGGEAEEKEGASPDVQVRKAEEEVTSADAEAADMFDDLIETD